MSDSIDETFTITCGRCGKASHYMAWRTTTLAGELPSGHYQCPICSVAFERRQSGNRWPYKEITLAPIQSVL